MSKEEDEELAMEINSLKKQLEISLQKSNFLEKENQELRQELGRLKSQIQSLKAHNNEIKFMDAAVAGADSPPQIPAAADIREPTRLQKQSNLVVVKENQRTAAPAPAPLPTKMLGGSNAVRRVPEVLELYRSLTNREATFLAYLSAIKSKVETHGEFVNWLIRAVNAAAPKDITEVEMFVKWLDRELALLVDERVNERVVLKQFPRWPKGKADALREAAFSYRDLKSLESEVCAFRDNPKEEMSVVLKRALALQNRVEQSVSNVERTREYTCNKYKNFQIPCQWMLNSGLPTQMKLSSLRLAKEYMQRITKELQSNETPQSEKLFLLGAGFAYRVHQYAGGFDSKAILAFEELKKVGLGSQRQL